MRTTHSFERIPLLNVSRTRDGPGDLPALKAEARQRLTVRGVLSSSPTTQALVDFVRVLSPLQIASPQTEASAKAENAVTFEARSEKIQTIATWIPASRQIMDDFAELASFLQSGLLYYTNLAEELQLLSGSGTGTDLDGLITQSDAFNTALLGSGWTRIDIIGDVIQQITVAKEIPPTFVILHPFDWWRMRLLKDSLGRYILGDPQTVVSPSLFGLSVVPTVSIASGTFLVGSGDPEACEIRDRQEAIVEISTEYSDYFVKNLVAVRCEKRLAFARRILLLFGVGFVFVPLVGLGCVLVYRDRTWFGLVVLWSHLFFLGGAIFLLTLSLFRWIWRWWLRLGKNYRRKKH